MNGRKARMLRAAAGVVNRSRTYDAPQIHHLTEFPVFETHERTIRAWDPKAGKIVGTTVEKVRYLPDGKTPAKPLVSWVLDEAGELVIKNQTMLVPVAKPARLKAGSPRRVYQALKRLYLRGLDKVAAELGGLEKIAELTRGT